MLTLETCDQKAILNLRIRIDMITQMIVLSFVFCQLVDSAVIEMSIMPEFIDPVLTSQATEAFVISFGSSDTCRLSQGTAPFVSVYSAKFQ